MGIRNSVNVDIGLDVNKILLVGLLVFTLVGSIGLYLPENLAFAGSDDDDDDDKKDKAKDRAEKLKDKLQELRDNKKMSTNEYKAQVVENTAQIEAMSTDFDLFKGIAETLNSIMVKMDTLMEDFKIRIAGVEGELQKEIQAREAAEASFKAEIDAMKSSGDLGSSTSGGGNGGSVISYNATSSGIAMSGEITDIMALCNTGDFALSAENTILSAEPYYVDVFTSEMSSLSSWHLSALNSHPTDDIQIDVTVTCIQSTPEGFSKATNGFQ